MLETRGLLPDFVVTTVAGTRFAYGEAWHRKNLVLVALGAGNRPDDGRYAEQASAELAPTLGDHTVLVLTRDRIAGEDGPLALVADKWGEIHYLTRAADVTSLPPACELGEWLTYIRIRCSG